MAEQVFSLVVADDEEELREAVCRLIDWRSAGFELVGSAGNGLDALQLVEQLQPDLLLTDIRMPFISGTSLARQVRELQPLIQVAFLSGYDDFEYARSAIDSQVISYLLKPISMAELTEALREIHRRMEEKFRAFLPGERAADLSLAAASLLLDGLPEPTGEEERRRLLREGGMELPGECSFAALAAAAEEGELPQNAAEIVEKALRGRYGCAGFVSGRRILCLFTSQDGFSRLDEALDELSYVLRRVLRRECALGVSRPFESLERSAAACREAVDAARLSGDAGIRQIGPLEAPAEERLRDEQQVSSRFDALLFGGDRAALEELLGDVLGARGGDYTAMQVLVACQGILRSALGEEELSALLQRFGLTAPFSAGLDAEALRGRIAEMCLEGQRRIAQSARGGMRRMVERTLRIIEQRYMDEGLSLGSVSEELHISPNYLSANMKKYAGDTFINLLIQKRMEAARLLIQAPNIRIGEVAEKCGYSDQHYFSFCFKKYWGVSPARMRRGEEEPS